MPQLDVMTFFTQFFWFSLNFVFFYLLLLHFIIPLITINLKYREKILQSLAIDINKKKENASDAFNIYDNILLKTFSFFRVYISKILLFADSWIVTNLSKISVESFALANSEFLKIIVEKSLCLYILNNKLKTPSNAVNWSSLWNKSRVIV